MRSLYIILLFIFPLSYTLAEPSENDVSRDLIKNISKSYLGSESEFVEIPDGSGWHSVALAPTGSTIEPLLQTYSGLHARHVIESLSRNQVFDRPLVINDGRVTFSGSPMVSVWNEIIQNSMPSSDLQKDRELTWNTMRWLFSSKVSRGEKIFTREPSRFVKRYNIFQKKHDLLRRLRNNGNWKFHPQLSKYDSLKEAETDIVQEWYKSGYKAEVESAKRAFFSTKMLPTWIAWERAYRLLNDHSDRYRNLPKTILIPPPSSWSTVSSWRKFSHKVPGTDRVYYFELARVAVMRPWFDIFSLIRGDLKISHAYNGIISDGKDPSKSNEFPEGKMPAYVKELLLVREITSLGSSKVAVEGIPHALSVFSNKKGVNLLGYIVHVLPKIEAPKLTAVETGTKD